jgi:membrane associated rhomboid family serine protease
MTLSLTVIIILITSAISIYAFQQPELLNRLLFHPYSIRRRNEWYRFVSSGFVHGSWLHLLFNMFTFYWFGEAVERYVLKPLFGSELGGILFITLFVIGIIIAHISTYIKYKDAPHYRSLGASGGVAAVVFCSIMFYPVNDLCLYGLLCIPGFILGPLYLIYSYYQGKKGTDNINHEAHLFGAIFGIVFAILVDPRVIGRFVDQVSGYQLF